MHTECSHTYVQDHTLKQAQLCLLQTTHAVSLHYNLYNSHLQIINVTSVLLILSAVQGIQWLSDN